MIKKDHGEYIGTYFVVAPAAAAGTMGVGQARNLLQPKGEGRSEREGWGRPEREWVDENTINNFFFLGPALPAAGSCTNAALCGPLAQTKLRRFGAAPAEEASGYCLTAPA